MVEEDVVPREYRTHSVTVGNVYRGAPPEDVPFLIDSLCQWLNGPDFQSPEKDFELPFAVIRSVLAHLYLAWIHAFGDGNGRTARLVEFHILFSSGVPLPAAHLLSDHYNRTRTVYYRELDKAIKSGGNIMPFLSYALQGLLDGLRGQITEVRSHQMEVAWENYVHQQFKDKNTKTQKRRRDLVLELTGKGWINVSEIVELTPKTAMFYANVGNKMLQRDLNALKDLDLIEREFGRVRSRRRKIASFLPAKVEDNEE